MTKYNSKIYQKLSLLLKFKNLFKFNLSLFVNLSLQIFYIPTFPNLDFDFSLLVPRAPNPFMRFGSSQNEYVPYIKRNLTKTVA